MKKPEASREAQGMEFLRMMRELKETPPKYLAIIALMGANVGFPFVDEFTAECSIEDKAAAISELQYIKAKVPNMAEWIDNGIAFVQENWMQGGAL